MFSPLSEFIFFFNDILPLSSNHSFYILRDHMTCTDSSLAKYKILLVLLKPWNEKYFFLLFLIMSRATPCPYFKTYKTYDHKEKISPKSQNFFVCYYFLFKASLFVPHRCKIRDLNLQTNLKWYCLFLIYFFLLSNHVVKSQ